MKASCIMDIVISRVGEVLCIYDELVDLSLFGNVSIERASHVEPDDLGQWWADLEPVDGPNLGPFPVRSAALEAEQKWLGKNWLGQTRA